MTDAELVAIWTRSLILGVVVIVAAAALLISILLAARRILRLALVALDVVRDIRSNTNAIWALRDTHETAGRLLEAAESIRDHGALVAGALEKEDESSVA